MSILFRLKAYYLTKITTRGSGMCMDGLHHRHSIRLHEFDYSLAGAYFVTICTHKRERLFGDIQDGNMKLNGIGQIIDNWWNKISTKYRDVRLDEYRIMPNHFHGIVWILDHVGAPLVGAQITRAGTRPAPTLGEIVGGFKSITTVEYIRSAVGNPWKLWQRNYYEHIIRNENELFAMRKYIIENPLKWRLDSENR